MNINVISKIESWYHHVISRESILMRPKINNYEIIGILYNIILLLVPYYIGRYLLNRLKQGKILTKYEKFRELILGFIWLLFIPNTAYIISDLRHLANPCFLESYYHVCAKNVWLIFFFFVYSVIGWISMYYLVRQMKDFLEGSFNKIIARIYFVIIIPIIALGVLMGLVLRWNSWQFFVKPMKIILDTWQYINNPNTIFNWIAITIILFFLYWLGDNVFKNKIKV